MIISGFDKLSLTNYPGVVACCIFTNGCGWACGYWQNSTLARGIEYENFTDQEVLDFLKKRKGLIDGICISGGEPTVQKDLIDFIRKCKEIGVKVKLDTNGERPKKVQELLDENLLDYIAMDIKKPIEDYESIAGIPLNLDNIRKTIDVIHNSGIDHEFRTTIIKEFHTRDDILKIIELTQGDKYFIQNFVDSENVPIRGLHGFTNAELHALQDELHSKFPNVNVRGLKDEH